MLRLEIGGEMFRLETAAISCVRYRAAYGESVIDGLNACVGGRELEQFLVRLCHTMLPPEARPTLLDFAALCRRDRRFTAHAGQALAALLDPDPKHSGGDEGTEDFDEYRVLAMMAAAGLDGRLLYELPILHLTAVAGECFRLKNGEGTDYHAMTQDEMARLYPR